MTYPLACDDIVQLTLKLVSFTIYALTISRVPLGAKYYLLNKNSICTLLITYPVIL